MNGELVASGVVGVLIASGLNEVLIASIVLRILGVGYSLVLLYRVRDGRFLFFTLMLSLMATRQIGSLQTTSSELVEVPGLIVSVLAITTVHYLSRYIQDEERYKAQLKEKNEQLRSFRKAVEHAGHAIFLTDTDGTIEYANPAVETVTGYEPEEVVGENPRIWKSGEHDDSFYADMWETVVAGEVWDGEIINKRKNGDLSWVDMTIAPITDDDGDLERFVAVDTDITERKEREFRIQQQNERLETLNTTNEVLRDINRELVQAESREEIETAVCERFAGSPLYRFAWVGGRNLSTGAVSPQAWAGVDREVLTGMTDVLTESEGTPFDRAAESGEPVFVENVENVEAGPWRDAMTDRECASMVAIPVRYKETLYGVLEIYAERTYAFEAIDRGVLGELGETIGYAINAIESKRALLTDTVTELEFRLGGDHYFATLSAELDAGLELERVSAERDGFIHEYASVETTDTDAVRAFAESRPEIDEVRLVCEDDGTALFRFAIDGPCVTGELADFGASVTALTAEDGEARVTAELAKHGDVRAVVDALTAEYPGTELLAQRERENPVQTEHEFRALLKEQLTDRQLEALQTAFIGGFFEWPRVSTGEEVADVMGVSQSTFLQHLRAAHRKLLSALFEGEVTAGRPEPASAG